MPNSTPGWVERIVQRAIQYSKVFVNYRTIKTVAAATLTMTAQYSLYCVDYTATGTVALTLPAATNNVGKTYVITDTGANAGSNNITIARAGTDTITTSSASQTSLTISTDGGSVRLVAVSASVWKQI